MIDSAQKKRILFVCTHNASRSQMAEGLLRAHCGDRFEVFSAGTEPGSVHPLAIRVMSEIGIDISGHTSEHIDIYYDTLMDYVVTVCDHAAETCPYVPARIEIIHRSFSDPSAIEGSKEERLQAFREAREEIRTWLQERF